MHRRLILFVCAGLFLLVPAVSLAAEGEAGFVPIFDGKSLEGWDGKKQFWHVADGAITGETTKENRTKGNTFIIWKDPVADFELRFKYRIFSGNSGVQYRSKHYGNYVVGGYQADMDAQKDWAGANYHEKGRGILAKRGEKTVVSDRSKRKVVGSLGDPAELAKKIKDAAWNDYHIIAQGNRFINKINGLVMSDVTDNGKKHFKASGILALQLHSGPPMKVQFKDIRIKVLSAAKAAKAAAKKKKIVFLAGKDSHGRVSHAHTAGCKLLAAAVSEAMPNVETKLFRRRFPAEWSEIEGADALVIFADGGGGHPARKHLEKIDKLAKKGMGIVFIHYAVEIPKEDGKYFLDWIGGYFETHWSVNPHWTADFKAIPKHPVTRGVKPFSFNDEWYYHMRFREKMQGVTPILTAMPPAETLKRKDGRHSNNPHVRAAVLQRKEPQHVAWAYQRPGGGRGFGFTGGHYHYGWGNDNFRTVVLNAIAWVAKIEVPSGGVPSKPFSKEDLDKQLGKKKKKK